MMVMVVVMVVVVMIVRAQEDESRGKKALSIFTVVKVSNANDYLTSNLKYYQFPNTACSSSTSGRNGTCYTASECTAKGLDFKTEHFHYPFSAGPIQTC